MEKQFIKIESKGIIDVNAFILLGASSKRDDNTKIGFFGSGLKYSIAFLLRKNLNFKVFAEYKEIKFSTKNSTFRDKNFDIIFVDGKETSMTTEMGIDWESWFAIREIYCNAIDEGESSISVVNESDCLPVEEKTVFYIEVTRQFQEIIDNWNLYFSEKRDDLVYSDVEGNQIYAGGDKLIVYRKGIRCLFAPEEKTVFNYDLTWVKINESRVIKSDWEFKYDLRIFLMKVSDKPIISHILNTINSKWEKSLSWGSYTEFYSNSWLECVGDKTLVPYDNAGFWSDTIRDFPDKYLILPAEMVYGLKDRFLDKIRVIGDTDGLRGKGNFKVVKELTPKQSFLFNEAKKFLEDAGYEIKYPMEIVDFVNNAKLGEALDGNILISTKCFELGKKELVACIIEEQEHLVTGFGDESRAFQTHFIHKVVSLMEDKTGKYL